MTDPSATWHRDDLPGALRLIVSGELDLANAEQFGDAVAALVRDARSPSILDLGAVTFFDSSALAALVTADGVARDRGATLEIVASRIVHTVIELTGLDAVLTVRPGAQSGST